VTRYLAADTRDERRIITTSGYCFPSLFSLTSLLQCDVIDVILPNPNPSLPSRCPSHLHTCIASHLLPKHTTTIFEECNAAAAARGILLQGKKQEQRGLHNTLIFATISTKE
jgi:hypothetical protein